MKYECSYKDRCGTGALFDEAKIIAGLPDETIIDLGWEAGSRVVMNAVLDTYDQLTPEQLKDFNDNLPSPDVRCKDCCLGRNAVLQALSEPIPDSPAELDETT